MKSNFEISVVVPTHNRPNEFKKLLQALSNQSLDGFEVIIINDGKKIGKLKKNHHFDLIQKNIPDSGAATARNVGIKIAKSPIIAFTDDDCIPDKDWLRNALKYFRDKEVVGIEGVIYSDKEKTILSHTPEILEKKIFVQGRTANMIYRREVIDKIGFFDKKFVIPFGRKQSFREDTDFAWRALKYGKIPFAPDVKVYHPLINLSFVELVEYSRLKMMDPLLLKKHPDKMKWVLKLTLTRGLDLPFGIMWFLFGMLYWKGKI